MLGQEKTGLLNKLLFILVCAFIFNIFKYEYEKKTDYCYIVGS